MTDQIIEQTTTGEVEVEVKVKAKAVEHKHHWELHIYYGENVGYSGEWGQVLFKCSCGDVKNLGEVICVLDVVTNHEQK